MLWLWKWETIRSLVWPTFIIVSKFAQRNKTKPQPSCGGTNWKRDLLSINRFWWCRGPWWDFNLKTIAGVSPAYNCSGTIGKDWTWKTGIKADKFSRHHSLGSRPHNDLQVGNEGSFIVICFEKKLASFYASSMQSRIAWNGERASIQFTSGGSGRRLVYKWKSIKSYLLSLTALLRAISRA